jgi:chorismate mutase
MDEFDALVALVVQRLALAEDVAAAKFASGQPVDDPLREREVLDSVARRLIRPRGLHEHWRDHPEDLPVVPHNLAVEVRPRLDHITGKMLSLFVRVDTLPRVRHFDVEDLLARGPGATSPDRRLDQLRWDAATIALRSVVRRT